MINPARLAAKLPISGSTLIIRRLPAAMEMNGLQLGPMMEICTLAMMMVRVLAA